MVTIVGLSTEGYQIASTLAAKKIPTAIVDESLQMSMELKPGIVTSYSTVSALVEGEPLLRLQPVETTVSRSQYVFFAPKIRKTGEEAKAEFHSKLRTAAKDLSNGSTFVTTLPVGIGENSDIIMTIEKLSGLKEGEGFHYVFAPLKPRSKIAYSLGLTQAKPSKELLSIFEQSDLRVPTGLPCRLAELAYCKQIISKYCGIASEIEAFKRVEDRSDFVKLKKLPGYREIYLDELVDNLFDLRIVRRTLETGDPLLYLANGTLKSVEGYTRRLIEEVRSVLKVKALKASRTRLILAWTLDSYEMRGDKQLMLSTMVDRLKDHVGDITTPQDQRASLIGIQRGFFSLEKTNLIILCSERDLQIGKEASERLANSNIVLLKADLTYGTTE